MAKATVKDRPATAVCALPECDQATTEPYGAYCGPRHRDLHHLRNRSRPVCPVCVKRFDRGDAVGRPAVYCSSVCKSARENAIARATKALARDDYRGDPVDLLADAELLFSWWYANRAGTYSEYAAVVVERFWPGNSRPKSLSPPPDPRVRRALGDRIARLRKAVDEQGAREAKLREQAAVQEAKQRLAELAEQDAAADRVWRDALLKGDAGGDD